MYVKRTDGHTFTQICEMLINNPENIISPETLLSIEKKRVKALFKLTDSKFISA